jgi:hypothetical protein
MTEPDRDRCASPAIFAANGDYDRAKVFRCALPAGHKGSHRAAALTWSDRYPVPEPERIAAAEAGRLRAYDQRDRNAA